MDLHTLAGKFQMFLGVLLSGTLFVFFFANEIKIIVNIIVLCTFAALVLGLLSALVPDFCTLLMTICWELLKRLFWYSLDLILRYCKQTIVALCLACIETGTTLLEVLSILEEAAFDALDAAQVPIAQFFQAAGKEVGRLLRSFVWWFKSVFKLGGDNDSSMDPPAESFHKRLVFIVSRHSCHSCNAIRRRNGYERRSHTATNWDDIDVEKLPMPKDFINHFALCLISVDLWNDQAMSVQQKFEGAVYWDYCGPEQGSEDYHGVSWDAEIVLRITGFLYVGCTTYDDEAIAQDFYHPLKTAWIEYDADWWNCFDFAVRLACMLLADDNSKRRLWPMLLQICASRIHYHKKQPLFPSLAGFVFGLVNAANIVASGSPVFLIIVGSTVVSVASGAAVVGSVIFSLTSAGVGYWKRICVESKYMRKWKERSRALEQTFPQLIGLIDPVEGEFAP